MNKTNKTKTYRVLNQLGLISEPQKYGSITLYGIVKLAIATMWRRLIFNYAYKNLIFEPINKKVLRPKIWRLLGCEVGKNVMIGHSVRLDFGNTKLIKVEDNVIISNNSTILCHKRNTADYSKEHKPNTLPFTYAPVVFKEGCQIGINCTILPGVTIGEGSIIGSCSLVTKDIPDWSIAVGAPAKVIKSVNVD